MFRKIFAIFAICVAMIMPIGCSSGILDPSNPTTITIWHYYNGAQKVAFDTLVEEFNHTEGRDKGIYVDSHSKGTVGNLETEVLAAFRQEVGSSEPPDIFSSYADTAYAIEQMGVLVDLEDYLTQSELDTYVESFISEGRIGNGGELRIFPTAKSSEIFMMNKTAWDEFTAANKDVSIDMLTTMEGVAEVAEKYYEWTDGQTPEPNDGKAFYGRDAMANLFIIGSMQLGVELFKVDNGKVTLQINKEIMKKIWDTYYVPFVKGYFSALGKFRSDDVKTGDIIAYTGATTSASYFPSVVKTDSGEDRNIDYIILPVPVFEGGENYLIQQGAGMVVTKTDEKREYASITFLKWFTNKENNLLFGSASGYMPVKKDAFDLNALDEVIRKNNTQINSKTYDTIKECFDMIKDATLYTNKAFENGADARKILENHLADKAIKDRAAIVEEMNAGIPSEQAVAPYITDEKFEEWFKSFSDALNDSIR